LGPGCNLLWPIVPKFMGHYTSRKFQDLITYHWMLGDRRLVCGSRFWLQGHINQLIQGNITRNLNTYGWRAEILARCEISFILWMVKDCRRTSLGHGGRKPVCCWTLVKKIRKIDRVWEIISPQSQMPAEVRILIANLWNFSRSPKELAGDYPLGSRLVSADPDSPATVEKRIDNGTFVPTPSEKGAAMVIW
jgi:hypothetical protein